MTTRRDVMRALTLAPVAMAGTARSSDAVPSPMDEDEVSFYSNKLAQALGSRHGGTWVVKMTQCQQAMMIVQL